MLNTVTIANVATGHATFAPPDLSDLVILHVRKEFAFNQKQEEIMARLLHNALGFVIALGTGSLMVAVALV